MLIVEAVTAKSPAEQAGIQVGDRVVSYDNRPLPSPDALLALEENTFGKAAVLLRLERSGEALELSFPPGRLGVVVRPELPRDLLGAYEAGQDALRAGHHTEAAKHWQELAARVEENGVGAWLWSKAGEVWEKASDWSPALDAYSASWQRLDGSEDLSAQARTATALGRCHQGRSEWEAAVTWYARAGHVDRQTGREIWAAHSLINLGAVAWLRGDLQAAQDYFTRSLKIFERLAPNSLQVAASLDNLGSVARYRGDLQTAQDYHARALQIEEHLAPDSLNVAASLGNLGIVAWLRGDLQVAQDYHARSLKIKEHLAPDSLDVAVSLGNLGTVAWLRGDLQVAQDYFTRSLQIFERLAPASLAHAESLTQLGRTLLHQHHPDHALPLLRQAIEILEQQRSTIVSPEARALLLAQHGSKYAALIQGYLALNDQKAAFATLERGRTRSLLELLTERRVDVTVDASPELLREQQELDRRRSRAYDQLAQLSTSAKDTEQIDRLHEHLRELERYQQQLTARIRTTSPHYATLQYPQPLDCKAAQAQLQRGTLLLAFLVDEEQTFLFALTRRTLQTFTLPVGAKTLQELVHNFHQALQPDPTTLKSLIDQGKALFDLLLAPVQERIKRAKRLLLCPDGPLHTLPWPALVTAYRPGRDPHYLGQHKPLHTTLSMTVYAQTREEGRDESVKRFAVGVKDLAEETNREERLERVPSDAVAAPSLASRGMQAARKLLALGDPLYPASLTPAFARSAASLRRAIGVEREEGEGSRRSDTAQSQEEPHSCAVGFEAEQGQERELDVLRTRGLSLGPLPFSREEVQRIGALFAGQAVVRVGAEATKTAAMTESGDADVLHFACHGWLDPKVPLSSGLVFSQPEVMGREAMGGETMAGDNGLLQAWEIVSKLRLKL